MTRERKKGDDLELVVLLLVVVVLVVVLRMRASCKTLADFSKTEWFWGLVRRHLSSLLT